MKIMSSLFKFLLRIGAAAVLVSAVIYYFACTQSGLDMIWGRVQKHFPENIKIGSLQGSLISEIKISDFTYRNESVSITLKSLDLRWSVNKLLERKFEIAFVMVNGLNVEIQPSESDQNSSSFQLNDVMSWLQLIAVKRAEIHDAHIKMGSARIDLEGSLTDEWDAAWSANIPDLHQLSTELEGKFITSGTLTGKRLEPQINTNIQLQKFVTQYFKINSLSGTVNSQVNQTLSDSGVLRVKGLSIEGYRVPDFTLLTFGQYQHGDYQLKANAVLSQVNKIQASAVFPRVFKDSMKQTFRAAAKVNVKDFSQFNTLFTDVPQVREFKGRVTGNFTGSGELLHPVFDGGLEARQSSVYIPAAKMTLTNIHLLTRYHTGQKVTLNGDFTAGDGRASVDGTYDIEDDALPLMLNVRGSDVIVCNTKEYKIKISPDMTLAYRGNELTLGGKILVPYAEIKPTDFSTTHTLPNEVVIVNNQKQNIDVPTDINLKIQLALGDKVILQYKGLKTKLHGSITVTGNSGNPMTAIGQFQINDGSYRAYGRTLTIQQGKLIYAGNLLTNPGISLRAASTIKTSNLAGSSQFDSNDFQPVYTGSGSIVVGVSVSGTIDKPRVTLFSDEAGLSQGDILSYLLFGYPQSQVSKNSGFDLLGVASEMYGGPSASGATNNLQNKLGLDELSVSSMEYYTPPDPAKPGATSATQQTSAVNIGRNFGHNLSVHYSIGLFQQVQVFSLRYQINRHFAVQTETSTLENGGDLLYQLESAH